MTMTASAGHAPRRRRVSAGMLFALIVIATAIAFGVTFVTTVLWPKWPAAEAVPDAPALPITINGVLFNVPPAAIRIAIQRRPGAQERLDLAFLWPSLAPPDPAARPAPSEEPAPLDRVFVTIAVASGTVTPADRLKTIYPRYLTDRQYAGMDGLTTIAFREGSPYQGEDLYFDGAAPANFLVRCTRPAGENVPGMCLHERRIAGADVTLRFPRDWLADWKNVAEGIEKLIAGLKPAGS
jgi:hypothetical protein